MGIVEMKVWVKLLKRLQAFERIMDFGPRDALHSLFVKISNGEGSLGLFPTHPLVTAFLSTSWCLFVTNGILLCVSVLVRMLVPES